MNGRSRRRMMERAFVGLCLTAVAVPLVVLAALLSDVAIDGLGRLDLDFLTGYPSRSAARAGIYPAVIGSVYLIALSAAIALPLGIGAAVFLEEYGGRGRFAAIVEVNLANLAGVPSILFGLLGLGVFVRTLGMGRSLLAGACTMALLVLPIVVTATREALRTVPAGLREAGYALGATKWQTTWRVVLPMSLPGILTGAILSISRAMGETAPLIVVGAATYISFVPQSVNDSFTVLPIQIFNWVSRPQPAFQQNAAAGIMVLLVVLLLLNALAIWLRNRYQKRSV